MNVPDHLVDLGRSRLLADDALRSGCAKPSIQTNIEAIGVVVAIGQVLRTAHQRRDLRRRPAMVDRFHEGAQDTFQPTFFCLYLCIYVYILCIYILYILYILYIYIIYYI